jgi:diguanylate cyclase (GGDEF)-like protein
MGKLRITLAARMALIGIAVFAATGLLQFEALELITSRSFGALEDRASFAHVRRTLRVIEGEKSSLLALVAENAIRDDMLTVVRKQDISGLSGLLHTEWIERSGLDLIQLRAEDGEAIWSGMRDSVGGSFSPCPVDSLPNLAIPTTYGKDGFTLIMQSPRGALILAGMPVRDTAMREKGQGLLLFGRYLAGEPMARIGEIAQLRIGLMLWRSEGGRRSIQGPEGPFFVLDEGEQRTLDIPLIAGGATPGIALRIVYRPDAAPAARTLILQAGTAYVAAIILALLGLSLALTRLVIKPIWKLAHHLTRAVAGAVDAPLGIGLAAGRLDEIGILADRVDGLIEAERQRNEELAALNRELALHASTDSLTGLANRRCFTDRLDSERKRLIRERHGLPPIMMAFVMCDIDFFKKYNDRYGHQDGDSCLRAVAAAIAGSLKRPTDLASRHGGEEFLVMLPGTSEDGALVLAELIRKEVESLAIPHEDSPISHFVTLSLGVAAMDVSLDFDTAKLFSRADSALYRAKTSGRNRVVGASSMEEGSGEAGDPSQAFSSG